MEVQQVQIDFGRQKLIIDTGKIAKQANGAVRVQYGGTVVLVTACASKEPKEGINFFPLTVEYQEKTYAAGRIPGGFFKREGRPSEGEILAARLIDRPCRPLFPEGMTNEVQIMAMVLSSDAEYDPDILALIGASTALSISDIPFNGPVGACRVGMVEGQFILNPNYEEREKGTLDLVVAGTEDNVIMLEGNAKEVDEKTLLSAVKFGHDNLKISIKLQKDLVKLCGEKKMEVELKTYDKELFNKVRKLSEERFNAIFKLAKKEGREEAVEFLGKELIKELVPADLPESDRKKSEGEIKTVLVEVEKELVREFTLKSDKRIDGRSRTDIRPITCEIGVLPRTHGSSLFTRGQTQSLAVTTLGTRNDEQMIEALEGETFKTFMLHYSFPPFSVGEVGPVRGPGRREIGHGALAEKALKAVMPEKDKFPYTVRVVSEILESNGSSSMASVCAATLSLMDAGVPIKEPVAGVALGLITEKNKTLILTDISGLEDHFGDMDFKIAGTKNGVNVIQLDLKVQGVGMDIISQGLDDAKKARMEVLQKMLAVIAKPKETLSDLAPRITTLMINPEKIGELIGPGGKTIRKIIQNTGVTIDIEDDGSVLIASTDAKAAEKAIEIVKSLTEEVQVGKVYTATVKRIVPFGAFCEILPNKEGLIHISELASEYVRSVEDVVKLGDKIKAKVIGIDELGRINLSKKQAEE
ncbi:MAG TPA: polyribonucleotide nucleotidyltransferase [Candidatus Omnitrophota bacterium]|nr:polyribonucleotide nucleotidyltransferase [Candidatus Omnitrophota bacterium]